MIQQEPMPSNQLPTIPESLDLNLEHPDLFDVTKENARETYRAKLEAACIALEPSLGLYESMPDDYVPGMAISRFPVRDEDRPLAYGVKHALRTSISLGFVAARAGDQTFYVEGGERTAIDMGTDAGTILFKHFRGRFIGLETPPSIVQEERLIGLLGDTLRPFESLLKGEASSGLQPDQRALSDAFNNALNLRKLVSTQVDLYDRVLIEAFEAKVSEFGQLIVEHYFGKPSSHPGPITAFPL